MVKKACSKFVCDWIDPDTNEPCLHKFKERGNLQVSLTNDFNIIIGAFTRPYWC